MTEKRHAKNPLLYIHQPVIKEPKAMMQSNYQTPKERKKKETIVSKSFPRKYNINEHKEEDSQAPESVENKKDDRPNFNEMSLEEKVTYLVDVPEYVPKIKCIVKTEVKTYEGIVTSYKDDNVYIRVGRRVSTTEIPFKEIKSIRLLGF